MTPEKTRVSLTLTKVYRDALDYLEEEGIYLDKQEAIRDALRILFGAQGISPFYPQGIYPFYQGISPFYPQEAESLDQSPADAVEAG